MIGNAIKTLDTDGKIGRREAKVREASPRFPVGEATASVVSGSAATGYKVDVLTESGGLSGKQYAPVGTVPPGAELSVGQIVQLQFKHGIGNPEIIVGGSGGGDGVPRIASALGFVG